MYKESENVDEIYYDENNQSNLPLKPFLYRKKCDIDCSILYSLKGPFDLPHADTADLRFLAKSAVDPKYFLLVVNLFTSKIYTYHMKKGRF